MTRIILKLVAALAEHPYDARASVAVLAPAPVAQNSLSPVARRGFLSF